MRPVVLVHGWAFDASVWNDVQSVLQFAKIETIDFGFYGAPQSLHTFRDVSGVSFLQEERPIVAVGHSLGLLWLLRQESLPAGSVLVGINGFSRFSRAAGFESGVAPRVLERMKMGLKSDARRVLTTFRETCGSKEDVPDNVDFEKLADGLDILKEGDSRARVAQLGECGVNLHILASMDDPIATPDMTRACFPEGSIQWISGGGHMLPLTHAALCAETIRHALEENK